MPKRICLVVCAVIFTGLLAVDSDAQRSRKSVSAAEVNGTFLMNFAGKFKGSSNEVKILALGKGKIKIAFDLVYPYIDGTGHMSANMGQLEGMADISGDTAIYSSNEFGVCTIIIKFVKPGMINISQESDGSGCGFGHNVTADGTYRRVRKLKPKF